MEEHFTNDDNGLQDGEYQCEQEVMLIGAQQAKNSIGGNQRRADCMVDMVGALFIANYSQNGTGE